MVYRFKMLVKGTNVDKSLFYVFVLFTIMFFSLIFLLNIPTDIQEHNQFLQIYLEHGKFPVPPLYYFTVFLFTFTGISSTLSFTIGAILVLSLMKVFTYSITESYFKSNRYYAGLSAILSLILMFLSPLYLPGLDEGKFYLGKFTSSIWHNSTTIFVIPFCILLFFTSVKYIRHPRLKLIPLIFLYSVCIILSKPSFLFAFIPAFPIIMFFKHRFDKWFYLSIGICIILFGFLLFEKHLIYATSDGFDQLIYNDHKSSIIFAPFAVWKHFSSHLILSFFESLAFIIFFCVLQFSRIRKSIELQFSYLMLFFALIIYMLIAEGGARMFHGNFYWQVPICMLLVYMCSIPYVLPTKSVPSISKIVWSQNLKRNQKFLLILLGFHFLFGLAYILKIFYSGNYF